MPPGGGCGARWGRKKTRRRNTYVRTYIHKGGSMTSHPTEGKEGCAPTTCRHPSLAQHNPLPTVPISCHFNVMSSLSCRVSLSLSLSLILFFPLLLLLPSLRPSLSLSLCLLYGLDKSVGMQCVIMT